MAKVNNSKLANILDLAGLIEIVAFPLLLVTKIWISDTWVVKALQTDAILFIATFCIYFLLCYIPKEDRD